MTLQALVVDHAWPDLEIEREVLREAGITLMEAETGSDEELLRLVPGVDAIMVNWRPLSRAVLRAARRCRTVARFGVGVDNIDVAAATELGILVSRVADYCVDEVAEHTMALLLALRRRVVAFAGQTRAGGWDNTAFGPIRRVRGTTLGIAGWGPIGQAVASRARGLGMRIEVWSRTAPRAGWPADVRACASLLELAGRVDHLTVHLPLTEQTAGLVGEEVFRAMRPTAVLINTARGPIVDAASLAAAVREGRIAGAGLDVLDEEPPSPTDPLVGVPNVVVTPHAAFNSEEALATLRRRAAANAGAVLDGRLPSDVANPTLLDRRARLGGRR